jgi:transposase
VVVERDGGELARTRRLGWTRFETAVRRLIVKQGRQKPCLRIARRVFTALADAAGVHAHRAGALERVALLLEDWTHAHGRLADTEARMLGVLNELQLSELVTSIPGISPLGAAAVLAQSGDPRRFTTARALVKHAGLAPRQKLSGTFIGRTKLTGQGRPGLRFEPPRPFRRLGLVSAGLRLSAGVDGSRRAPARLVGCRRSPRKGVCC